MEAAYGALVLLRVLSESPASRRKLEMALEDEGIRRDERTIRRWLGILQEADFDIVRHGNVYEMLSSPARIPFGNYEAFATLSVIESLAEREPVYGEYLATAAEKLRKATPKEALDFVDSGRIEFALESVSDPPEDPEIMDRLRRAIHRSKRTEIFYHSLTSDSRRWRTVEPVGISYSQRAHRLHAFDLKRREVREFRVNRIEGVKSLPDTFSPETHRRSLAPARIRLSETAFIAYGKRIVADDNADIELLDDGGAIISGKTPSTFWTVREVAALGPEAEILGGDKLQEEFVAFLEETLQKYA